MQWKKANPSQSAIGLSWHPFVGNSQQRINHQLGFCSTKMHSFVLSTALALKLFKGNTIGLAFHTFVALNYWYYIMKTSSRLVLCPREPVLNHKMAHMRKTLRENWCLNMAKLIAFQMQNVIIWHLKPIEDNNVNVFFAPGVIIYLLGSVEGHYAALLFIQKHQRPSKIPSYSYYSINVSVSYYLFDLPCTGTSA